ncbi:MAG: TonB-dependent receptor [Gammaproteobacteria bacterium]|jgi:iron complex outermembrane receptor protein
MNSRNSIRTAVRYALTAGVAASVMSAQAFAADSSDSPAKLEKVEVTGSRIKRLDLEGPSPVTVIDQQDIQLSGKVDVADVLRATTFNTFGSFRESSGSSAQSQAVVSLRGLGAQRTLVLLDGRRMAGAPAYGAGSAQNLNVVPLAAVERIEILRDGASAIYGSDAIGGVINIILRKDYEGVHVSAEVGRPTQPGGDEAQGSIVGGISSGRGNITFAMSHHERQMIFNGDRPFSAIGLSAFGYPGSFFSTDGAGGSLGTFPDARCPSTLDPNNPDYPSSVATAGGLCRFNYARTSANEAAIKKDNMFVNGNFEISDNTNLFARGIVTRGHSFGRYAPTPVVGGSPFVPTMAASNPNNPTNPATPGNPYASQFPGGPYNLSIYYRNVPGGFRDSTTLDLLFDALVGLNGSNDWFGGSTWEVSVHHSRQEDDKTDRGYGVRSILQKAIDDGSFDIFAVNGPTNTALAQNWVIDGFTNTQTRQLSTDGQINFDLAQTDNGPLPVAFGYEYADEEFTQDFDAQQNAANVDGSAGGADVHGTRNRYSAFGEIVWPILTSLEADFALRYDSYNDFGTTVNPKLSVKWTPTDSVLIRGSYGEGFRAPSMSELYTSPAQSFNTALDRVGCAELGGKTCNQTQYQNFGGGNQDLGAEESKNWNVGAVWNPTNDFSLGVDFYNIKFTNQISTPALQYTLDQEYAAYQASGGACFPNCLSNVGRGANGKITAVNLTFQNLGGVKTRGFDFDGHYSFSGGASGDYKIDLQYTKVLKYEQQDVPGAPYVDLLKQPTAGASLPDSRANAGFTWSLGDWDAQLLGHWTAATSNNGDAGLPEFGAWTTWDLQVGYALPWNGKISVGARNLTNEDPPTDTRFGNPNYNNQLYDVYGRVPYIRYDQDL